MATYSRKQKKRSDFDLGMSEWTGDADEEKAPNSKKLRLSVSKKKKEDLKKKAEDKENSERFSFINATVAEQLESRYVPKNTATSTKWALTTFEAWRNGRNLRFPMEQVPEDLLESSDVAALNKWLTYFVAEVRKKDGTPYPPKTIYIILTGILRHMRQLHSDADCPNFLDTKDHRFAKFHSGLDNVLRDLRVQGVGADSQQTEAFSTDEEQILWESGVLGIDSPTKLLRTVFFLNGKNFCLRGRDEQRLLRISQVQRYTNPDRYVYTEGASKNRCGGIAQLRVANKVVPIVAVPEVGSKCHVKVLDEYLHRLPKEALEKDNFYVQPRPACTVDDAIWFTALPIGRNTLGKMVREICEDGKIQGKKTNHSLRATGVSDIFQAGVPEKMIQERSGHLSTTGLRRYQRTTLGQEEVVSKVLSTGSTFNKHLALQQETKTALPLQSLPQNHMNFSGCTVTINYNSAPAHAVAVPQVSQCSSSVQLSTECQNSAEALQ